MSTTRDPTFKSIMFALLVGYIALVSQSVLAKGTLLSEKSFNCLLNLVKNMPKSIQWNYLLEKCCGGNFLKHTEQMEAQVAI